MMIDELAKTSCDVSPQKKCSLDLPCMKIRNLLQSRLTLLGCVLVTSFIIVLADAAEMQEWKGKNGEIWKAEYLGKADDHSVFLQHSATKRQKHSIADFSAETKAVLARRGAILGAALDPQELAKMVRLPNDTDPTIRLPLRFILVHGIVMNKDGVAMRMWVSPEQVKESILPEINRIWKQANIQWDLECIIDRPFEEISDCRNAIAGIERSKRDGVNVDNARRVERIGALSGVKQAHPSIHQIHLFPFLGSTYQGFANVGGNVAFLGVFSDKISAGKKPPTACLLIEAEPMKFGSIGRTAGHELGHNLGLLHPNRKTQKEFDRLMGGANSNSLSR
jgi:hypothetical protein